MILRSLLIEATPYEYTDHYTQITKRSRLAAGDVFDLWKRRYSAKETYDLKPPHTNTQITIHRLRQGADLQQVMYLTYERDDILQKRPMIWGRTCNRWCFRPLKETIFCKRDLWFEGGLARGDVFVYMQWQHEDTNTHYIRTQTHTRSMHLCVGSLKS